MTAEHVGLVVREAWAVKAKVVTALVVGVGFTHPVMSRENCRFGSEIKKNPRMFNRFMNHQVQ